MRIEIPEVSLVVLIGASGSGKSSFARRHFKPTEVLSSDFCRGLVSDDENDQAATADAFDVLHTIAAKRLATMRLVVVDATNVQQAARAALVTLAKKHHVLPVAIVFDLDPKLCHQRNRDRTDRDLGAHVVRQQHHHLKRSLRRLKREGFRRVYELKSPAEVDTARVERVRLWPNRRDEHGPFDIVGDIHGCYRELVSLFVRLGYAVQGDSATPSVTPPPGRRAVFLGDLVDRGPDSPSVLRLVMSMVKAGTALCVPGNHEVKLLKKLRGRQVNVSHGLQATLAQLEAEPAAFREEVAEFIDGLVSHFVLDDGKLVVAHAGLSERLQGRASRKVRSFALYGETTGETDAFGLPVRTNWAGEYRGSAMVVYGHTPTIAAEWLNRTLCIDTGCVFGGKLTALRYPERELVSVPAQKVYYTPVKPLGHEQGQRTAYDSLDLKDVLGKRIVTTRFVPRVTLREENAAAALEVMSRWAIDPRWLIYLPPTVSPSQACPQGEVLEHPEQAFEYYARQRVVNVVCEEKHMGSRAIVVVCRDPTVAERRFRIASAAGGAVFSRTGRPFFRSARLEVLLLERIRAAVTRADLWQELATDWICLDAELMPWSFKAGELCRSQYAAVGAAGTSALAHAVSLLHLAEERGAGSAEVLGRFRERQQMLLAYGNAWRRFCWAVESVDDLKLAPFHLLAGEGRVYTNTPHDEQLDTLAKLADGGVIVPTPYRVVALDDPGQREAAVHWWEELTTSGGEGIVIKPQAGLVRGKRGFVQPALKCRGQEYLRIVYGPEYSAPQNLKRLRNRGLSRKRSLALREYALGLEALERFVAGEPLYRVHQCVFGVLALESEPVDPRL